jgi:HSP20 family protein
MLTQYAAPVRRQDLFREINRFFGDLRALPNIGFPPVNIWSSPEGAIVTAEIPGVTLDEIDVTVHQNTVSLRGKRDPEMTGREGVRMHLQERPHGPFARIIVLPFRADADNVSARFDRGILRIDLPRPEAEKPHKVRIAHG